MLCPPPTESTSPLAQQHWEGESKMYSQKLKSVCLVLAGASFPFFQVSSGYKEAPPITLTARANPPAVFPGEAVTLTATPGSGVRNFTGL